MKKAKIVLSAVALFALLGGAFAFKASRTESRLYYSVTQGAPACLPVFGLTTTNANQTTFPPATATGWYTTPNCNGPITLAITTVD